MYSEDTLWFGVRSLCLFGRKQNGINIYEERILLFSGADANEALLKAGDEVDQYARDVCREACPFDD